MWLSSKGEKKEGGVSPSTITTLNGVPLSPEPFWVDELVWRIFAYLDPMRCVEKRAPLLTFVAGYELCTVSLLSRFISVKLV